MNLSDFCLLLGLTMVYLWPLIGLMVLLIVGFCIGAYVERRGGERKIDRLENKADKATAKMIWGVLITGSRNATVVSVIAIAMSLPFINVASDLISDKYFEIIAVREIIGNNEFAGMADGNLTFNRQNFSGPSVTTGDRIVPTGSHYFLEFYRNDATTRMVIWSPDEIRVGSEATLSTWEFVAPNTFVREVSSIPVHIVDGELLKWLRR